MSSELIEELLVTSGTYTYDLSETGGLKNYGVLFAGQKVFLGPQLQITKYFDITGSEEPEMFDYLASSFQFAYAAGGQTKTLQVDVDLFAPIPPSFQFSAVNAPGEIGISGTYEVFEDNGLSPVKAFQAEIQINIPAAQTSLIASDYIHITQTNTGLVANTKNIKIDPTWDYDWYIFDGTNTQKITTSNPTLPIDIESLTGAVVQLTLGDTLVSDIYSQHTNIKVVYPKAYDVVNDTFKYVFQGSAGTDLFTIESNKGLGVPIEFNESKLKYDADNNTWYVEGSGQIDSALKVAGYELSFNKFSVIDNKLTAYFENWALGNDDSLIIFKSGYCEFENGQLTGMYDDFGKTYVTAECKFKDSSAFTNPASLERMTHEDVKNIHGVDLSAANALEEFNSLSLQYNQGNETFHLKNTSLNKNIIWIDYSEDLFSVPFVIDDRSYQFSAEGIFIEDRSDKLISATSSLLNAVNLGVTAPSVSIPTIMAKMAWNDYLNIGRGEKAGDFFAADGGGLVDLATGEDQVFLEINIPALSKFKLPSNYFVQIGLSDGSTSSASIALGGNTLIPIPPLIPVPPYALAAISGVSGNLSVNLDPNQFKSAGAKIEITDIVSAAIAAGKTVKTGGLDVHPIKLTLGIDLDASTSTFKANATVSIISDLILKATLGLEYTLDSSAISQKLTGEITVLDGVWEGKGSLEFISNGTFIFRTFQSNNDGWSKGMTIKYSADGNDTNDTALFWQKDGGQQTGKLWDLHNKLAGYKTIGSREVELYKSWKVESELKDLQVLVEWDNTTADVPEINVLYYDDPEKTNLVARFTQDDFAANGIIAEEAWGLENGYWVFIDNPNIGVWDVEVMNSELFDNLTFSASSSLEETTLELISASVDSSNDLSISYTTQNAANDSEILIYIDTNKSDFDGILLDVDSDLNGSFSSGVGHLKSGTYYLYAELLSDQALPAYTYFDTPIEITSSPVSIDSLTDDNTLTLSEYDEFVGFTGSTYAGALVTLSSELLDSDVIVVADADGNWVINKEHLNQEKLKSDGSFTLSAEADDSSTTSLNFELQCKDYLVLDVDLNDFSGANFAKGSGRVRLEERKPIFSLDVNDFTVNAPEDFDELYVRSDINTPNATEAIGISDVISQLRHIVGLDELTGLSNYNADIDDDGDISISDVISNLRTIVGLENASSAKLVNEDLDGNLAAGAITGNYYLSIKGDVDLSWQLPDIS